MRYTMLGELEVSVVGLGCNNFGRALDADGSRRVVDAAIDAGMTFFDTSDNYGNAQSEGFLGRALGSRREEVVVATKFGSPVADVDGSGGAHPAYVGAAARRSLERLETDWIDLYQLHKPDPSTPIADTLGAMWELVDEGLVREIGCSNLDADQLEEAIICAGEEDRRGFISNQVEYSLINPHPQRNGLKEVALRSDIALLPFYPLANGLLTGKVRAGEAPTGRLTMQRYESYLSDENFDVVERLRSFAQRHHANMAEVALGWLLAQPEIPAVTPGATKPEQAIANAAAADWIPDPDDLAELERLRT